MAAVPSAAGLASVEDKRPSASPVASHPSWASWPLAALALSELSLSLPWALSELSLSSVSCPVVRPSVVRTRRRRVPSPASGRACPVERTPAALPSGAVPPLAAVPSAAGLASVAARTPAEVLAPLVARTRAAPSALVARVLLASSAEPSSRHRLAPWAPRRLPRRAPRNPLSDQLRKASSMLALQVSGCLPHGLPGRPVAEGPSVLRPPVGAPSREVVPSAEAPRAAQPVAGASVEVPAAVAALPAAGAPRNPALPSLCLPCSAARWSACTAAAEARPAAARVPAALEAAPFPARLPFPVACPLPASVRPAPRPSSASLPWAASAPSGRAAPSASCRRRPPSARRAARRPSGDTPGISGRRWSHRRTPGRSSCHTRGTCR